MSNHKKGELGRRLVLEVSIEYRESLKEEEYGHLD